MNYKLKIMTWMLVGSAFAANGQSISQEVLASAGEHFENGNTQLSWTLGEVMIDTYSSTGNILTQGFHQTQLTVTGIEENSDLSFDVNVYPNPTAQFLNVAVIGNHSDLDVALFDAQGKLIFTEKIMDNQPAIQLNLSSVAMGRYVLLLTANDGTRISSHQIVRSNE